MGSWLDHRSGLVITSESSSPLFQTISLGFVWRGSVLPAGVLQEARVIGGRAAPVVSCNVALARPRNGIGHCRASRSPDRCRSTVAAWCGNDEGFGSAR